MTRLAVGLLGWVWWWLVPVRARHAAAALHRALPNAPVALLRHAVGSVAWGYVELVGRRRVRWTGLEAARGGAVLFTGHLGPWDPCLVAAARIVPLTVFLKTPTSPVAAAAVRWLRRQPGVDLEPLPVTGAMDAARAALARGRLVVFVLDQRHAAGIPVPFFGRPAWTSAAFAAMVFRDRPRVFASVQWRAADGSLHARAHRLHWSVPEERDVAVAELTARTQAWLEARVREHPGDWWWLHRRWRVPPCDLSTAS